jgi:pimeloyl-ACP methyl ester carboxylesterase
MGISYLYSLDQFLYAATTESVKKLDIASLREEIASILAKLGLLHVHAIVGVGLGGLGAMAFAAHSPKLVDRLVICNTLVDSQMEGQGIWNDRLRQVRHWGMGGCLADKACARWLVSGKRGSTEWERLHRMVSSASEYGFELAVSYLGDFDESAVLSDLRTPTLFLAGSDDHVVPEHMEAYPSMTSAGLSQFEIIPRTGRLPMLESPQSFVEVIEQFLFSNLYWSIGSSE